MPREIRRIRHIIFLRDILYLSVSCFGGAQAHLAHFMRILVEKRHYITEAELMEVNMLCQILPGPTSTQTLTAIGHRLGGAKLAYLTLLIWAIPSVMIMTICGIWMGLSHENEARLEFTRFIQPIAVGMVAFAAYSISLKTVHSKFGLMLMIISGVASFFVRSPVIFPIIMVFSGVLTAINYRKQEKEKKKSIRLPWQNLWLWIIIFVAIAGIGGLTKSIPELLPIRLFENFYRNGSLIFGGGQVLIPLLYTEFVEFVQKQYVTSQEFLTGYALAHSLPGPFFSFSAYIGVLSMRQYGLVGEIFGGLLSALGIFLPGTFLIFFMIRAWDKLKTYRPIRASLEGILAASAGMVTTAAIMLFQTMEHTTVHYIFILASFFVMVLTRIPSWMIIVTGLVLGVLI